MIQPDEHQHHTIWTPELVEISLPLAGVARRCMALLVDQCIIGFTLIGLWLALFAAAIAFANSTLVAPEAIFLVYIALTLFSAVCYFCYFWVFHTLNNGQTPGKMWLKIRLVTDRGGQANTWTCFIRSLFDVTDMVLLYGISVILILTTQREKRIADFAAGTIVILDR